MIRKEKTDNDVLAEIASLFSALGIKSAVDVPEPSMEICHYRVHQIGFKIANTRSMMAIGLQTWAVM
jgi:hypothetical protein